MMRTRVLRTGVLLTAVLTAAVAPTASAAGSRTCSTQEQAYTYVVLFQPGTPPGSVDEEIRGNCGAREIYYKEIGVAVATSQDPAFGVRFGGDRAFSGQRARSDARQTTNPLVRMTVGRQPASDLSRQQWDMRAIKADKANAVDPGRREVVVGVIDTGVDASHPDLAHAVDKGLSVGCETGRPDSAESAWAPKHFHGTGVAGAIAAAADGKGITGVAPGVRIAALQVLHDDSWVYPEAMICAFMWAADKGFTLTNGSLNSGPWAFLCADRPGEKAAYEAIRRAVLHARVKGVQHVASAGNWTLDLSRPDRDPLRPGVPIDASCKVMPNQLPEVVTVSAVGYQNRLTGYSDFGYGVIQATAPGGEDAQMPPADEGPSRPLTTLPGGQYGSMGGTSSAAPRVTGVLALLAGRYGRPSPPILTGLLRATAVDPIACPPNTPACEGTTRHNGYYGYGLVNAFKAVTAGTPG